MKHDTLDKKKIGLRIRAAREARNWTREQLAEKMGMSVNTMAEIELGRNGTRLENFVRLCRLLDLNADYVLFGAPGDTAQRIADLLRDRDEETVRVVEKTVEALLQALDAVPGIERYRISSIEPNLITEEIIDWIASGTKFQPHFHIPLQTGSDELLRRIYEEAGAPGNYESGFFDGPHKFDLAMQADAFDFLSRRLAKGRN